MNNKNSGTANFTKAAKVLDDNKMARFNGKLVVILWKDNLWCSALLLNELFAS